MCAQQIWRLTHEVLDAALSRLPELKDELEKQMITRRGLVLAKLRKSFLFAIELARTRTQKDAAACVLPWALAVQQVALNVPPSAMEGLRAVLGHSVSYRRAWQFLRDLTVVIVRSYPTWWPGKCVGFADDNFQVCPCGPPNTLATSYPSSGPSCHCRKKGIALAKD